MLPLIATETRRRGLGLGRAVELLSTVPARLFDLHPRKGSLAPGADADIAIVDTRSTRTIDARELEYHDQEKWSPYDGREVDVWPVYTLLRGQVVFAEGEAAAAVASSGEAAGATTHRRAAPAPAASAGLLDGILSSMSSLQRDPRAAAMKPAAAGTTRLEEARVGQVSSHRHSHRSRPSK